jgi:hypothetical protein
MKCRGVVLFLLAGIIFAGVFTGCFTAPESDNTFLPETREAPPEPHVYIPPSFSYEEDEELPPLPPPPPQQEPEKDVPRPSPSLTSREFPLVPITREIIQQVSRSGLNVNKLRYFLSSDFVLEYEKTTQSVDINDRGEGILRDVSVKGQVAIKQGAGGVLVDYRHSAGELIILEVGFDSENEDYTLSFLENPEDHGFDLMFDPGNGDSHTVSYGDEVYTLRSADVPRLLIRFEQEPSTESFIRELKGRYINE